MPGTVRSLIALAATALLAGMGAEVLAQRFRAQSDLVVLQVSVHDRHGEPVADLSRGNFRVWEDDVLQDIRFFVSEDQPVAIGLVVDNSSSMGNKRREVVAAAEAFVACSNPQDELFTVNFNEHVTFGLPAGTDFTSDPRVLSDALGTIGASGQTALYDGIAVGLARVKTSTLDRHVLVVVSDGDDNRSRLGFRAVLDRALRSEASIYAVGVFDPIQGGDRHVLERLAETTGGLAYFPEKVREIREVLDQICLDVRHRYTIGYVSDSAAPAGAFRRIKVQAVSDNGVLRVHARSGYIASDVRGTTAVR